MAANSWNLSGTSWGLGLWGEQSDTTITLTGIGLTSSVGTAQAFNTKGTMGKRYVGFRRLGN